METRDFAERILFGSSLDDKLIAPVSLSDLAPGRPIRVPDAPGRPHGLAFPGAERRKKAPFPKTSEIDREDVRGRVLHFFANHELLALELMALVLLRFPEAPASFRRGLVETMREEQKHMQLYTRRMQESGVELGAIPVNDFFWRSLRNVDRPLDFVAGMSLTLEQANLDYSLHFAKAFREVGDTVTADILDIVYAEEIGHVKHGVVWFERWTERSPADFDDWAALLEEPMSPARARGIGFDAEGRRRAGFSDRFIERVRLFRASRGRPPRVWYFNPAAEYEALYGAGFTAPQPVQRLAHDLATLPMFFAAEDDIVLVTQEPSEAFRARLAEAGITVPEFVVADDWLPERAAAAVPYRHIEAVMPWGLSPKSAQMSEVFAPRTLPRNEGAPTWSAALRGLYNKALAAEQCRQLLLEAGAGEAEQLPLVACSPEEVQARLQEIAATGGAFGALKACWSNSGRGLRRVQTDTQSERDLAWVARTIREQGAVVVEPWFDRVADLSLHLDVRNGEAKRVGIRHFITDHRGQFRAVRCGRLGDGLSAEVMRFLHAPGGPESPQKMLEAAARRVSLLSSDAGYEGPVGVDAFVYRRSDGSLAFRPLIEVNPRWTMGRLAVELCRRIKHGRSSGLVLLRETDARALGSDSLRHLVQGFEKQAPPVCDASSGGVLIDHGCIALTELRDDTAVVAMLAVAETEAALWAMGIPGLAEPAAG